MPGPESEIIATFVAQLKSTDEVPTAVADRLADLLSGDALPKPQVLVELFEVESGEALA